MHAALAIMIACILIGRLCQGVFPEKVLSRLVLLSILFLLFLLGAQIGANDNIFEDLLRLGWQSLMLMLLCVGGSIAAALAAARLLKRRGLSFIVTRKTK